MSARPSQAAPPAAKPTRPYRNFLTPFLHRQFTNATVLSLGACYVCAVWMGGWQGFFWTFFPILRTIILMIPVLAVYVIRVSQWHVGTRTSNSQIETFWQYAFRPATFNTIFWYSVSAFLFIETYMWSQPVDAGFGFIDQGKTYERPRMNEQPIYLRAMFFILAIVQAGFHLYHDYDKINLPCTKFGTSSAALQPAYKQLLHNKVHILNNTLKRVIILFTFGNAFYAMFRSYVVWNWIYWILRGWYTFLPKTGKAVQWPALSLAGTIFVETIVLCGLWEVANHAFSTFIAQEPLKNGAPITDESKDLNGSLLIGLKAKKDLPKNMAFWELAIISQRFEARRKTIFAELDRKNSSTWKQVLELCLTEIRAVKTRIEAVQTVAPPSEAELEQQRIKLDTKTLPRITNTTLKDDAVVGKAPAPQGELEHSVQYLADFAKRRGQQPYYADESPVKKMLRLKERSEKQLEQTSFVKKHVTKFIVSSAGAPFRQTFARRATAVLTGTPYSRVNVIANAVTAITELVARSIREDIYGTVRDDVDSIIKTLVEVMTAVDGYLESYTPHWTDVYFHLRRVKRNPETAEIKEVREVLIAGLKGVLEAFNEYLPNMGLSEKEIRDAKVLVDMRRPDEREEVVEERRERAERVERAERERAGRLEGRERGERRERRERRPEMQQAEMGRRA